eukprot:5536242-Pyramimonas_sp.AAC.1
MHEHAGATHEELAEGRLMRCPAGCGFVSTARVVAGHLRAICSRVAPLRGSAPRSHRQWVDLQCALE